MGARPASGPNPDGSTGAARDTRREGLTVRDIVMAGCILLAAIVRLLLAFALQHLLAVLFLGAVLGVTFSPLVDRLCRYHVPAVVSVLVVYLVVFGLLALFGWYAFESLREELDELDELEGTYQDFADEFDLPTTAELRDYLNENASGLFGQFGARIFGVLGGLFDFIIILLVAILVASSKDRMKETAVALAAPAQRARASDLLSLLGRRVRQVMLAEVVAMLAVGVLTFIGLTVIGMPFPVVLAAIAFVTELLPLIGPWIGFVPAAIVAATQGWVMLLKVAAVYAVIQQLEGNVIQPLVQSRVTHIPALLVVSAVLAGTALMGILGALVALPLAVIGHTLYFELVVPWRQGQFESEGQVAPAPVRTAEPAGPQSTRAH